jgi:cation:H+ antiporter
LRGSPGLALGNAVGSIICDTGLILGLGILIRPMRLERKVVNRQGWIQLSAGALLVLFSLPFGSLSRVFSHGGRLPQWAGFLFLALLVLYIVKSIQWSRKEGADSTAPAGQASTQSGSSLALVRLAVAIGMVVGASWILIPAVKEAALRLHVPEGIIAATLVAFGTSLPELVTVVAASLRGHSELALGNVIGADILNVLFVAGAAAAVTPGGLTAQPDFFRLLFPAMLGVLILFRIGIFASTDTIKRPFGVLLLGTYVAVTTMSYLFR